MANKAGYFSKWYAENKERVNRRRRRKYHQDPKYRRKVLQQSRDYRETLRSMPQVKMPRFQKPLEREVDGGKIQLFSVGAFSQFLGRSVQSINHWEKLGVLPKTPYRDNRGFRYYTRPMMAAVKDEVAGKKRLYPVDPEMHTRITNAWKRAGVPVNEVDLDTDGGCMEEAIRKTVVAA